MDDFEASFILIDLADYVHLYGAKDLLTELEHQFPDVYKEIVTTLNNKSTDKKLGALLDASR